MLLSMPFGSIALLDLLSLVVRRDCLSGLRENVSARKKNGSLGVLHYSESPAQCGDGPGGGEKLTQWSEAPSRGVQEEGCCVIILGSYQPQYVIDAFSLRHSAPSPVYPLHRIFPPYALFPFPPYSCSFPRACGALPFAIRPENWPCRGGGGGATMLSLVPIRWRWHG